MLYDSWFWVYLFVAFRECLWCSFVFVWVCIVFAGLGLLVDFVLVLWVVLVVGYLILWFDCVLVAAA